MHSKVSRCTLFRIRMLTPCSSPPSDSVRLLHFEALWLVEPTIGHHRMMGVQGNHPGAAGSHEVKLIIDRGPIFQSSAAQVIRPSLLIPRL